MPMKGARSKVPLTGHFIWLSKCQDWLTKSGCHLRILNLKFCMGSYLTHYHFTVQKERLNLRTFWKIFFWTISTTSTSKKSSSLNLLLGSSSIRPGSTAFLPLATLMADPMALHWHWEILLGFEPQHILVTELLWCSLLSTSLLPDSPILKCLWKKINHPMISFIQNS